MRSLRAALLQVASEIPGSRKHILPFTRKAFNKYNAPELIGQLLSVLEKEGLEDAVEAIRQHKIPQIVDKAWKNRGKEASVSVTHVLKQIAKYFERKYGFVYDFDDRGVGPSVSMWEAESEPIHAPMFSAFYDKALNEWVADVREGHRTKSDTLDANASAAEIVRMLERLAAGTLQSKKAAGDLWGKWLRLAPKADPDALATLLQEAEREGNEATTPQIALEMMVWDLGYQGVKLPTASHHYINVLAKQLRVNVKKHHADGVAARHDNRYASFTRRSAARGIYELHGFRNQSREHVIQTAKSMASAYKMAVQLKKEGYQGYIITPSGEKVYLHMLTPQHRKFLGSTFTSRQAKANVTPVRQRTQYSCMSASMAMALVANGIKTNEDEVNEVMGAKPMRGASWEDALACAQHFGMRATLMVPCTIEQLKEWTDAGIPVMIAWNPEGRPWSHASLVYDVTDDEVVVADPNIPNPNETTRRVSHEEFYRKWSEKWPNYLVRRPALAIEREITPEGKQATPSILRTASHHFWTPMAGNVGWKHTDPEILARLLWIEDYERVKDRNVPSYHDVVDDELLADGIPELMDNHAKALKEWEQWNRQGWWPKPVRVRKLFLTVQHRKNRKEFDATFSEKDLRKAMAVGERVAEALRAGKNPPRHASTERSAYPLLNRGGTTFSTVQRAEQIAKRMQRDEQQGDSQWTFKVVPLPNGRAHIEVYDEDNYLLGKVAKRQPKEVKSPKKDDNKIQVKVGPPRNKVVQDMIQRGWGAGKHHNRDRDVAKGRNRKPKHKRDWSKESSLIAQAWIKGE